MGGILNIFVILSHLLEPSRFLYKFEKLAHSVGFKVCGLLFSNSSKIDHLHSTCLIILNQNTLPPIPIK